MKIKEGREGGKVERKTKGRRGIRREGAGDEGCEFVLLGDIGEENLWKEFLIFIINL